MVSKFLEFSCTANLSLSDFRVRMGAEQSTRAASDTVRMLEPIPPAACPIDHSKRMAVGDAGGDHPTPSAAGCPMDHKALAVQKEALKKTQIDYASGCPMHAENHADYIDPTNMVSTTGHDISISIICSPVLLSY